MKREEPFVFVRDELVPSSQATLLISDLSILRGYGVFDFFKTIDHRPVFMEAHLDRFFHSAERLRLDPGKTRDELRAMIGILQEANDMPDSGIRLTLTGGYSADGYTVTEEANLLITQTVMEAADEELITQRLNLITHAHQRQLPDAKTIDYLMGIWLQPLLKEKGAYDVLYHQDGIVTECPRSNFFIVTAQNVLVTPGRNVLRGITRAKVLELARRQTKAEERDITLDELAGAKEMFITSTGKNIVPITMLYGKPVHNGAVGEMTRWLHEELHRSITLHALEK